MAADFVLTEASRMKACFALGMPIPSTAQQKIKVIKAKCKVKFVT